MSRAHLDALTRDAGIMQFSRGTEPDPAHGTCTDDEARALQVDVLHAAELGWAAVEPSIARHVAFLWRAFDPTSGRFRNLADAEGRWLDAPSSEDASARALLALGETIAAAPPGGLGADARTLFEVALPSAGGVRSLRPVAAVLLACEAVSGRGPSTDVRAALTRAADRLRSAFDSPAGTLAWPWPEPVLTYENELPARALIVGGRRLGDARMTRTGLRVLDWLVEAQSAREGHLSVIGNDGWWGRAGARARYDQQPISVTSVLLAADAAYAATGEARYRDVMERAYAWFLGRNDQGVVVADPSRGGCRDGLGPGGASENQGAESTLMWLMALERIRRVRAATSARSGGGRVAATP